MSRLTALARARDLSSLALFTCLSIWINGYHFGVGDHAFSIPFLKSYFTKLPPNDLLLNNWQHYPTFFWMVLAPFTNLWGVEQVFFVAYFFSAFGFFTAVFYLSKLLFENKAVAYLSVIFLLTYKPVLGWPDGMLDDLLRAQTAAMPFLLLSVYLFIKGNYKFSFLILGVSFNFHAKSAFYILFMLTAYLIFHFKRFNIKILIKPFFLFLLSALPILIWVFSIDTAYMPILAPQKWVEILRVRSSHHIFPFAWGLEQWKSFLPFIAAFLISLKYKPEESRHRIILFFLYCIILMCILGVVFTEVIPVSIFLNIHLFRSTKFFVIFAVIYFANYLFNLYQENIAHKLIAAGLFAAIFFFNYKVFTLFLLVLLFFMVWESIKLSQPLKLHKEVLKPTFGGMKFLDFSLVKRGIGREFNKSAVLGIFLLLVLASVMAIINTGKKEIFENPRAVIVNHVNFPNSLKFRRNNWVDVQLWAKANTDSNAMFITPPYIKGFRVYSERAIVGSIKDGTLSNFGQDFAYKWWQRMEDLNSISYEKSKKTYEKLEESSKKGYNLLAASDFIRLSRKYGADYVVVEKRGLNLPLVYKNGQFYVYKIK